MGGLILTTDVAGTHTEWLQVLGREARVKKREFTVIVYGIRVNQVQGKTRAKEDIYKQNPKLKGHVEILILVWKKKFLRSGRIR